MHICALYAYRKRLVWPFRRLGSCVLFCLWTFLVDFMARRKCYLWLHRGRYAALTPPERRKTKIPQYAKSKSTFASSSSSPWRRMYRVIPETLLFFRRWCMSNDSVAVFLHAFNLYYSVLLDLCDISFSKIRVEQMNNPDWQQCIPFGWGNITLWLRN